MKRRNKLLICFFTLSSFNQVVLSSNLLSKTKAISNFEYNVKASKVDLNQFFVFNQLISKDANNPESTQKQVAEHMKQKLIERMRKSGRNITRFNTNSYEDSLLDMIVLPQQIEVRFNDIGGLDNIKRDLTETVLVPLMYPQLTRSSRLCQPPLGVLFYGPPGTGKSMMAKAIARETNATFIS